VQALVRLLNLAMGDELTWRLRNKEKESCESYCRHSTETDSSAPSVGSGVLKPSSESACDELAKGDAQVVERDHPSSISGWSDFTNKERSDHRGGTHPQANDESTDCKLRKGVCCCL